MKSLLLFDVDGTLVDSDNKIIEEKTFKLLHNLKEKGFDLGIVGGGKLEKILKQIKNTNYFNHLFTECGCVYHKNISINDLKLENIYTKNIRNHELYPKINILIKLALLFISQVDYTITGNFIDLRNGIIYISLIGMSATDTERNYFIEKDKHYHYRKQLIDTLKYKAKELNIIDKLTICKGGEVGIGLYPNEYDKIQVLEHLNEYSEIHYFGDKYEKDGNDYKIINDDKIIGHPVDNISQTQNILESIEKYIYNKL